MKKADLEQKIREDVGQLRLNPFRSELSRLIYSAALQVSTGNVFYLLTHIPSQGEHVIKLLVDGTTVLSFDIPYSDPAGTPTAVEIQPVETFMSRRLGRRRRSELVVAIALSKEELESHGIPGMNAHRSEASIRRSLQRRREENPLTLVSAPGPDDPDSAG